MSICPQRIIEHAVLSYLIRSGACPHAYLAFIAYMMKDYDLIIPMSVKRRIEVDSCCISKKWKHVYRFDDGVLVTLNPTECARKHCTKKFGIKGPR